jgi:two-component system chemotaxis sensor kinase CheA
VIPLEVVLECLAFGPLEQKSAEQRGFIVVRGSALPIVVLREQLKIRAAAPDRENVIVVRCAGKQIGLVVDELLGELQTVIKPLGGLFRRTRGISGSALLGSGQVALILDINQLLQTRAPSGARSGSELAKEDPARALSSAR